VWALLVHDSRLGRRSTAAIGSKKPSISHNPETLSEALIGEGCHVSRRFVGSMPNVPGSGKRLGSMQC
jgi:hypothetical protein